MKMNVPTDLKYLNNSDKTCIEGVYVKKYTESMDSKIYTHLEENYDKYNGIKEFADKYSVSISAFKRKFNSFYSTTPAKWIRDKKLEKASKLLIGTDYSITEISHISGFESLSSFNLCFKNKYGLAPTEYRKMN